MLLYEVFWVVVLLACLFLLRVRLCRVLLTVWH